MKRFFLVVGILAIAFIPSQAEYLLDTYYARIGNQDHYSSRGVRLNSVAAVIRQDRANYHKFHIRDEGDSGDSFFGRKSNRARLERMLNHGYISRGARNAILYGNPYIVVKVYDGYIDVSLR